MLWYRDLFHQAGGVFHKYAAIGQFYPGQLMKKQYLLQGSVRVLSTHYYGAQLPAGHLLFCIANLLMPLFAVCCNSLFCLFCPSLFFSVFYPVFLLVFSNSIHAIVVACFSVCFLRHCFKNVFVFVVSCKHLRTFNNPQICSLPSSATCFFCKN